MTMTDITFVDELPPNNRTKYNAIISQLAARPNEWALISANTHSGALNYVRKRFPQCEWATRKAKQPDGNVHLVLYGRHVGQF
jgi:hypothetical protein